MSYHRPPPDRLPSAEALSVRYFTPCGAFTPTHVREKRENRGKWDFVFVFPKIPLFPVPGQKQGHRKTDKNLKFIVLIRTLLNFQRYFVLLLFMFSSQADFMPYFYRTYRFTPNFKEKRQKKHKPTSDIPYNQGFGSGFGWCTVAKSNFALFPRIKFDEFCVFLA